DQLLWQTCMGSGVGEEADEARMVPFIRGAEAMSPQHQLAGVLPDTSALRVLCGFTCRQPIITGESTAWDCSTFSPLVGGRGLMSRGTNGVAGRCTCVVPDWVPLEPIAPRETFGESARMLACDGVSWAGDRSRGACQAQGRRFDPGHPLSVSRKVTHFRGPVLTYDTRSGPVLAVPAEGEDPGERPSSGVTSPWAQNSPLKLLSAYDPMETV